MTGGVGADAGAQVGLRHAERAPGGVGGGHLGPLPLVGLTVNVAADRPGVVEVAGADLREHVGSGGDRLGLDRRRVARSHAGVPAGLRGEVVVMERGSPEPRAPILRNRGNGSLEDYSAAGPCNVALLRAHDGASAAAIG